MPHGGCDCLPQVEQQDGMCDGLLFLTGETGNLLQMAVMNGFVGFQ